MASPRIITFLFLIFTNFLVFGDSFSENNGYHDFLHCLIDQFELSNLPTDIIYTPKNATYASLLLAQNLWPASNSTKKPDLIVTPFHVSEIQAAIFCSKKLRRRIAVRSGGHDYEGLSYTSKNPFVIVDMRNFRSVTVDEKEKTAWVQVGATLGQLYYTISRKSKTLAFPAGACPTVGVGGHFAGGGYSFMSRKHSIAADHIIDARLVNADGKILNKRAMGEDLFWAIRGGGSTSFGIILEFRVRLVTVPEKVTVFNLTRISEEKVTELVDKWQHVADKIDENLMLRLFLNPIVSPETGNKTILASFNSLYLGRARDLLPIMQKKFPELGLVEKDCMEMSWIESILYMAGLKNQPHETLLDRNPTGFYKRTYFKGKSDFVSTPIPANGLREIWKYMLREEGFGFEWSPYGGAMNKFSESETPFPHRKGNIFMIHYGVTWKNRNESQAHIDWMRRFYDFMARYVTKSPRAAYINYRDLDIGRNNEGNTSYEQASVWGLSYFKSNFKRLVRVKTKVDSTNFFRNEQSIPPMFS